MYWKNLFPKNNRYFETDNGILYYGDNRIVLNYFHDGLFDFVLLDPPFDIWNDVLSDIYTKKMKSHSFLLTFSRQPYTTEIINYFSKIEGIVFRDEIIWHDPQPIWVSSQLPLKTHENILIFRKGNKKINPFVGEKNNQKIQHKGKSKIGKWTGKDRIYKPNTRKMITSLLNFPRNLKSNLGRLQKPEKLIETLLECFTSETDIILDPFLGSGTTAVAAEKLNRKWIGIEISEDHCKIAKSRILKEDSNEKL